MRLPVYYHLRSFRAIDKIVNNEHSICVTQSVGNVGLFVIAYPYQIQLLFFDEKTSIHLFYDAPFVSVNGI